ncbi:MAG: protease inhibitor I42 family protein, partial [Caldisericia bacterium]|nr:protease inhibitor I42 family protein [Caldisericia bacterium]
NDTEVAEMAEIKTMMVPMRKDPVSGILDAVSDGMPMDGGGHEMEYIDQMSNETTLKLQPKFRMLIILPANQTTPYHWTDLKAGDESVASLTINEFASDSNPEGMMGVGGHRVFEIKGIAPGKTTVKTKQVHVADEDDVMEEFVLEVVVLEE